MARAKILPMAVMTPVEMLDAYRQSHARQPNEFRADGLTANCSNEVFGDTRCGLCKMYDRWTGAPKTSAARKPK